MAQHMTINHFKQKRFRDIELSIRRDFKRADYTIQGSLKYSYRGDETNELGEFQIWTCIRTIPKGIVWHTNKGEFEIHFDRERKRIFDIYLVA